MPAGTGEQRQLRRFTILYIKKQSVHYRILRSYKDTLHGPSDRIRTCGILLPKQARYQLRYTRLLSFLSGWSYSPKPGAIPTSLYPDIHFSAMIPRRAVKIKIFLSVVIYVVKAAFMPFSAIKGNPANAGVTRLCGVSPCPVPDTATALPKQARYQLRYTRLFRCFIRLVVFSPKNQAPYQLDHSRMPVGHYTPSVRKKQPKNTYPRTKKKSIRYKITGMPGLP